MRVLHLRQSSLSPALNAVLTPVRNFDCTTIKQGARLRTCGHRGPSVMARMLGRLLIVDGQRDFACLVGAIAERLGFATRILPHTLDFDYVMQHWHPDVVALQVAMADQQDLEVLKTWSSPAFEAALY